MNFMGITNIITRTAVHIIFRPMKVRKSFLKKYCSNIKNKRILEIGSGKKEMGKHAYSMQKYFDKSNKFECSDIDPKFGHKIVDITNDATANRLKNKYDVIMCLNVLEHVYEYQKAIVNLKIMLKKGGKLFVIVPAFYPLHDEPHDYWRFTEHSIRKMFLDFSRVEIEHVGIRKYPSYYTAVITK